MIDWLNCAKSDGLTINYLGGWNERGYNISWYEQLRSALNADGYSAVQIVGADSDWSVANDIASNSAFERTKSKPFRRISRSRSRSSRRCPPFDSGRKSSAPPPRTRSIRELSAIWRAMPDLSFFH